MNEPRIPRGGPVADAIRDAGLVIVLRRIEPRQRLLDLVDDLAEAGGRVFEITLDGEDAPADLAAARQRLADRAGRTCFVGAGTVRTLEQLAAAIDAGAAFGVSPVLDPPILAAAIEAGLRSFRGCTRRPRPIPRGGPARPSSSSFRARRSVRAMSASCAGRCPRSKRS